MNIINVLLDSLKLLKKRPQLFLPKLSSALISSLWTIFLFILFQQRNLQALSMYYVITLPLIILLGVFVPLMTAEMIRNRNQDNLLKISFMKTAGYWKKIIAMSFTMLFIIIATSAPAAAGFIAFYMFDQVIYGVLGLLTSLLMILAASFLIYFLPISVISKDTFMSGLESSVETSMDNRREVSLLMVFSFGLFILAFASQGVMRQLGFAAFIFGRLLSATVTTYTFVISPNYYLKEKED